MKLLLLIALAGLASASTLTFSYSGGGVSAFGTLGGALIAPGEYEITSGDVTIFDPFSADWSGSGSLIEDDIASLAPQFVGFGPTGLNFQVGANEFDICAVPHLGPQVSEDYRILLNQQFVLSPGGSLTITEGSLVASVAAITTPEPAAFVLVGIGLIAIGAKRRTK